MCALGLVKKAWEMSGDVGEIYGRYREI